MGQMLGQISTSLRSQARAPVTVLGLKGLKQADDGRTISMGESMIGKVRVGKDGTVSLHVTWRYRFKGKSREIRLGTWRDGNGTSLKALREERDAFATLLKTGIDPIEHRANERLRLEVEKAERERAIHAAAEAAEMMS